ncbi:unnamed protein product, partial [marine sediment metagenome]
MIASVTRQSSWNLRASGPDPEENKVAIRAVGGFACLVSEQVTFKVNLKIHDNCTLTGVWEKP